MRGLCRLPPPLGMADLYEADDAVRRMHARALTWPQDVQERGRFEEEADDPDDK